MPTLDIALAGLQNYSTAPLSNQVNGQNISNIKFTNTLATSATFNASQFGGANISNSVAIEGSGSSNAINISVTAAGTFTAAGWTFTNWSEGPDSITITATGAGNFNLIGSRKDDVINASAGGNNILEGGFGSDTLNGSAGNDTFFIRFPNQLDLHEVMSGAGGTDRIAMSQTSGGDASFDFRSATISSVEVLDFVTPYSGAHAAWFKSSQFNAGGLSSTLRVEGTDADDYLNIFIDTAVMDASGFNLINPAGSFHFNGTGYAERIEGSSARDVFLSRGGVDTLTGGAGDDTFNYYAADDIAAGTQISGGSGIDELLLGVFADDFDFTQASLSSIERVLFNASGSSVTFKSTQFGNGLSNALELTGSAGADVARVELLQTNSFSAAGWDVTSFGANDRVELVGTLGNDTVTGSASNDLISAGIGNDIIDGGAGNDSLEGSFGNDTISGGSGNDIINGGAGSDNLNGGSGIDTGVFGFARSAATITRGANNSATIVTGGDTDSSVAIERAQFSDTTVNLAKIHADFNGNGRDDILWRHDSGTVAAWMLNGTSLVSGGNIGQTGNDWQVRGTGDFNGDGKGDVLWRHTDGTVAAWLLNGTQIASSGSIGQPGNDWKLVGSGDFNGDGKSDILWRHDDGTVAAWLLNGTSITTGGNIGQPGLDWHVAGTGDFNGDGKDDILWRHDDGTVAAWMLNGTSIVAGGNIGAPGNDWHVQNNHYDFL